MAAAASPRRVVNLDRVAAAERIAAEISSKKGELLDLDRRRQQTMEALAYFRVRGGDRSSSRKAQAVSEDGRTWTCLGTFFLQLPTEAAHDLLRKDQQEVESRLTAVRAEMKRLLLEMQQFAPSELPPQLVDFALRENVTLREGQETELDDDEAG